MNQKLLDAVTDSYRAYFEYGSRSSKKLIPIHSFFHHSVDQALRAKLPNRKVKVFSMVNNEATVPGAMYPKNVDISAQIDGSHVGGISLKFVVTNYLQNSNNYFEHLLGETSNLRSNGYHYGSFSIIPLEPDYLSKAEGNKRGKVVKKERVTIDNLRKYVNLFNLPKETPFRPSPLGLLVVNLNEQGVQESGMASLKADGSERKALESMSNVGRFLDDFVEDLTSAV